MISVLSSSQSKIIKDKLKKILEELLPERDEMNCVYLDMADTKLIELYDEVESLPLGYDKKVVVAENFFYLEKSKSKPKIAKNDDMDPLLGYFRSPNPDVYLFLLVYADSYDDKNPFGMALKEGQAKWMPVKLMTPEEWKRYADIVFKQRGVSIDPEARDMLLSATNGDYSSFLNETEKLLAYAKESKRIGKEEVSLLVPPLLEDKAYMLSRSLSRGDKGDALKIYKDLKTRSISAVTLINMLAKEYRFLDEVATFHKNGYDAASIAQELATSPGRVNACLYTIRKTSLKKIREGQEMIYRSLLAIMSGKASEEDAFALLVANFPV